MDYASIKSPQLRAFFMRYKSLKVKKIKLSFRYPFYK